MIKEAPKISVIIPVYNVEKFLRECLDSLIAQKDFENWEAICVDDGASDGCGEILDQYAATDSRFRIVHQKNAGVSSARNKGISMATAPYLMFIDSDDWIEPNMFRVLYDTIERDRSDMVVCGYFHESIPEGSGRHNPMGKEYKWDKLIYGCQPVTKNFIRFVTPFLWNKIFKREIFLRHSLNYEVGVAFSEDHALLLKYLYFSKSVSAIETPLYHYRKHTRAVTCRYAKMDVPIEYYETTAIVPLRVALSLPSDLDNKKRDQFFVGLFALMLHQIAAVNSVKQIKQHKDFSRVWKTERKAVWTLFRMTPKMPALFYFALHVVFYYYRRLKRR